ncbi:SET domain-containing protein [Dendrothele bispora CBS 962.96]|uniref:SET domain-containing protein n=1 Tax=Dendrothele bispora (strain CBS 962.96) TaxID=1314807 RepID=A0A4S8LBX2_DENBC|nr:SET domain-containing protein [Dendrothele bispora CBS 962.96]
MDFTHHALKIRKLHIKFKCSEKSQIDILSDFILGSNSRIPGGLKRGKVDVGDFKAPEIEIQVQAIDNTKLDYADDEWFVSIQPAQSPGTTLSDVPDNWSVCYISGRAKRAILSVPGFPEPLPRSDCSRPQQYKIIETPGKGMGMFATRDIEYGELILTERPLLVFPVADRYMWNLTYPEHLTIDQIQQVQLNQKEKLMETLVDQMPKENQEAYKKLANCHPEDGSGPLHGILRTNDFCIRDYYEPKIPGYPEAITLYGGTFKDISRINHSCRPNACRAWDSPTFSLHLRASRPIKKGQEITLSYISDGVDPTVERQRQLASYGFTCTCEACSNPEISDPRSKQIKELLKPTVFMINPMMLGLLDPAVGNGLGMDKALLESSSSLGMASGTTQMSEEKKMKKKKKKKKGKGPPGPGVENVDDMSNMAEQVGQNTIEPALKDLKLSEEEGLTGELSSSLGMALGTSGTQMSEETKKKKKKGKGKGKGPPGPGVENVDDIFNMAKQVRQNMIEPTLRGLKLLEEEGFTGAIWYGDLLERVLNGYTMMALYSREMDREAIKWYQKSEKYKKLFKSARNAKWREEKEREERSKTKDKEMSNDDEEYKKLVDEMNKKMFAMQPRLGA